MVADSVVHVKSFCPYTFEPLLASCPFHADLVPILVHVHHKPWPHPRQPKFQPLYQMMHLRKKLTQMQLILHLKTWLGVSLSRGMIFHGFDSPTGSGFNSQTSQHITPHLRWINFGSIGSLPTRTKPESPTPWTTFDAARQTHLCLNMHCIVLCRHRIMINFNLV